MPDDPAGSEEPLDDFAGAEEPLDDFAGAEEPLEDPAGAEEPLEDPAGSALAIGVKNNITLMATAAPVAVVLVILMVSSPSKINATGYMKMRS